eukprot:6491193-Amphidinium_carterae.1
MSLQARAIQRLEIDVVALAAEVLPPTRHAPIDPLDGWRKHGMIVTYSKVARLLVQLHLASIPPNMNPACLKLRGTEEALCKQLIQQFAPRLYEVKCKLMHRLGKSVEGEAVPRYLLKDSFLAVNIYTSMLVSCFFNKRVHNHHGSCCVCHE